MATTINIKDAWIYKGLTALLRRHVKELATLQAKHVKELAALRAKHEDEMTRLFLQDLAGYLGRK